MIKPTTLQLANDQFKNIDPTEIIYAEITSPGGMGNAGGSMLYIIKNEELICYETNVDDDAETYFQIGQLLHDNLHPDEILADESHQHLFHHYYGGFGNHVYINVNAQLITNDGFFILENNKLKYQILPSVRGVFNAVSNTINPNNSNNEPRL